MALPFTLKSPLPPADLLFQSMSLSQGLSTLEEMQLNLLSDRPDIAAEDLLGLPLAVVAELRDGEQRHFCGLVTRFGTGPSQGTRYGYQAVVRPWLWFLTRTADCRIFQDQSVPDIVKAVFADHAAIAKTEYKLFRQYRPRVNCVQYRETDFNFVARLLEEEGIYWYFAHDKDGHTLVLVDEVGAHAPVPGCESLPYYANTGQHPPDREYISQWNFSREVRPGRVALRSYDFERPSTDLSVERSLVREHEHADLEQFDWQGDYTSKGVGEHLIDNRVDELQSGHERLSGQTHSQGLTVGHLFSLERHPRDDQNVEYLCVSSQIRAQVSGYEAGHGTADYQCSFTAMPSSQQFRPPRRTPKPFVQGPQTAVVVGPPGEEIHTDKHGRVRVQFHWDRYHQREEDSSCWMRVSHPWAGKGWGSVSIPRIGQEVIVDFLEGDPDQPIVTGRVYNGENMAPYALPANAATSGMKSKTHRGSGYNEISADDTAGKEKVTIHAQHDMSTTVQHDQTNTVNNKFTETIKSDAKVTVTEGTYSHDVAANTAKYHVSGDLTENYDARQTTTVKGDLTIVSAAGAISISADAKHIYIHAATSIQLHTGASKLWMASDGNISLEGVNITVKGSSGVFIKGGVVHSEAETENQTKGAVVLSHGEATNTVKGGMVMLNPD